MESTGIYWIPLLELLEPRGFEVYLVEPRQSRHAPGRPKSDVLDCQWPQRLHSYGLLTASFRPAEQVVVSTSSRAPWNNSAAANRDDSRSSCPDLSESHLKDNLFRGEIFMENRNDCADYIRRQGSPSAGLVSWGND
jgi:hypothetical protein